MKSIRYALMPLAIASVFGSARASEDSRIYIAPMASYVLADSARDTDDAYGGTLALGIMANPRFAIELRGSYLDYGKDHPSAPANCGGLLTPACPDSHKITSNAGGVGILYYLLRDGAGLYLHGDVLGGARTLTNLGLGWDLPLGQRIGLRAEALYHFAHDYRAPGTGYEEVQFNLGLRIPFGAPAAQVPPPVEEPATVVAVEPPAAPLPACSDGSDNDGDGAVDYPADRGCADAADDDESNPLCKPPQPGQPVSLDGCGVGDTIVLQGVTFEFDQARLTPNAKLILDGVAEALRARSDIHVEVGGHTDSKGSDEYNLALSARRAQAVLAFLEGKGVASARMSSRGYGEARPVSDNDTDEGRELNRRVELKVVDPGAGGSAATSAPMTGEAIDAAPAPSGGPAVSIAGSGFSPAELMVATGSRVVWSNRDAAEHEVSFPDQNSGVMKPGSTYSRIFATAGIYEYVCGVHPDAAGKVIVQ